MPNIVTRAARPPAAATKATRLSAGLCAGLACLFLGAPPALAQDFPSKTLHLVVPFPAGGTADSLPRILAEKLRKRFPEGVVVENKPGAGGNIGAEIVFRSDPDGHTLLVSPPGPIAINHNLYANLPFDPRKWQPVTVIAAVPNVLAVSSNVSAKSLAEFIDNARASPGKFTYASQGNGSTSHLTANLFESLTGTKMVHVPYKGTAPALTDLVGGQVDIFFDNLASAMPLHKAGKIRILAIADRKRSPQLPNVPTFAEAGLPAMQAVTWFAVVAPPKTPASTITYLHEAFVEALRQPDVQQRFVEQGAEAIGNTAKEMDAFVKDETARWSKVIADANVTMN